MFHSNIILCNKSTIYLYQMASPGIQPFPYLLWQLSTDMFYILHSVLPYIKQRCYKNRKYKIIFVALREEI